MESIEAVNGYLLKVQSRMLCKQKGVYLMVCPFSYALARAKLGAIPDRGKLYFGGIIMSKRELLETCNATITFKYIGIKPLRQKDCYVYEYTLKTPKDEIQGEYWAREYSRDLVEDLVQAWKNSVEYGDGYILEGLQRCFTAEQLEGLLC